MDGWDEFGAALVPLTIANYETIFDVETIEWEKKLLKIFFSLSPAFDQLPHPTRENNNCREKFFLFHHSSFNFLRHC